MRKRRATAFPTVPNDMVGFNEILNTTDIRKIEDEQFRRCFSTANKDYTLISVPELDNAIFQKKLRCMLKVLLKVP